MDSSQQQQTRPLRVIANSHEDSSSFSSSSYSSDDNIDNNNDNNNTSAARIIAVNYKSSDSEAEAEGEGFVSGEEEFVEPENSGNVVTRNSELFYTPQSVRPIARVTHDDDNGGFKDEGLGVGMGYEEFQDAGERLRVSGGSGSEGGVYEEEGEDVVESGGDGDKKVDSVLENPISNERVSGEGSILSEKQDVGEGEVSVKGAGDKEVDWVSENLITDKGVSLQAEGSFVPEKREVEEGEVIAKGLENEGVGNKVHSDGMESTGESKAVEENSDGDGGTDRTEVRAKEPMKDERVEVDDVKFMSFGELDVTLVGEGSFVSKKQEVEGDDLGGEETMKEKQVHANEVESSGEGKVAEESLVVDGKTDGDSVVVGPLEEKLVEVDGVGDSVVEDINVDLSGPGVAVVGDVEEDRDSDGEGRSVGIVENASLDNPFGRISTDVEEPLYLKSEGLETDSAKDPEPDSAKDVESAEVELNEQKHSSIGSVEEAADSEKVHDFVGAVKENAEDVEKQRLDDEGEIKRSGTDEEGEDMGSESSEVARQFLEELKQESNDGSHYGTHHVHEDSQNIDGKIATDSDEEGDSDEDGDGRELFNSDALTALLRAATSGASDDGSITISSQDGSRLFSVERPLGLGSSVQSARPGTQRNRPNFFTSSHLTTGGDSEISLSEEEKKKLEKLQQLRIKFLRLVHRLGYLPEEPVAEQVLTRLGLIGGMQTGQLFNLETAKTAALQLESEGKDGLDFSLNILVLGKTGTGKSATINSIFGVERSQIHAFEAATDAVQEIVGTIDGVKIRIVDTPGLRSAAMEQSINNKILSSVKKFTNKNPPDIVLYVDRLDTQTKDLNDIPVLRTITSSLGPSIWRNTIVTLTHAASAPPDGPSGSPLSYQVFVAQRSHAVQQSIGRAVGDIQMLNPSMMNPVSLVENHMSCRTNRDGEKVLPNGQIWKSQLLLLCYSMKILSEATSLSKPQSPVDHRKLFGFRVRSAPLPYILSGLLQSRTYPKLPSDQSIDNGDSDIDFADLSDSEMEEEDDYDQLPPFTPLKKSQLANLSREHRNAYFEEYDYRVKLLQKKQWKEELKRMREIKRKKKNDADVYSNMKEDFDQDSEAPATVAVPLPDMVLPPSFDGDNPAYRYRFLEPVSQFLARPVLDTHGWDHDCGYDGVNLEHSAAIGNRFPTALAVQFTKDKKEFNVHLDSSVAAKYGENVSALAGFDIQNIGRQLGYTVRGETKFKNLKRNKTAAGLSVTFLGENVATGLKLEDQIPIGKRLMLTGSTGTVRCQGDAAYGANLEVQLREADYPIGQNQSSLALSLVKWRGDLALGANLQSQFSVGRGYKMAVRAGLNSKRSGQISIRTSSSDQLQIALVCVIPVVMTIYKAIRPGVSENYSLY